MRPHSTLPQDPPAHTAPHLDAEPSPTTSPGDGAAPGDGTAPAQPVAVATGLRKTYGNGETRVTALDGVDLTLAQGRFTAVMGPSGSGKSTLMHCLAGLDSPTAGSVWVAGTELARLTEKELTRFRRDHVGFCFQAYNLLPMLTARQNILLPLELAGRRVAPDWFDTVTTTLGLTDRLTHQPGQMSGGQQQRVAVARALLTRPSIVFADEPTGNLDSHASAEVLGLLRRAVRDLGQTVVMVTHETDAAAYADDVVLLADGAVRTYLRSPSRAQLLDAHAEAGV